ncbi:MAG TPA: hypothetical protein VGP17_08665 [Solirubrobacteraceae bacterium]|jgi:hypothetical protein|nr:hypothetical protein [Solirubrobacteraceae bacterium]
MPKTSRIGGMAAICACALLALAAVAVPSVALGNGHDPTLVYSSIPDPLPANLPSVGAEAYAFDELGDQVQLANGGRKLLSVEVALSDWTCQTGRWYEPNACQTRPGSGFKLPLTLNLYAVGPENSVGAQLTSDTQTFFIPDRPSDSPVSQCPEGEGEQWYDRRTRTCNHGLATSVSFELAYKGVTLPERLIYGITYNTSHYGHAPLGESTPCYTSSSGCGYDSLNIALSEEVLAGVKPLPGTLYQQSPLGGEYCDGGAAGVGVFRLDSPTDACWEKYVPAVAFHTANPPRTRRDCEQNGWRQDTDQWGGPFQNQGDCFGWFGGPGRP